jgi:hypothetical protein
MLVLLTILVLVLSVVLLWLENLTKETTKEPAKKFSDGTEQEDELSKD